MDQMLDPIIAFCTSTGGLLWLLITSDFAIALAYFAIPITMAFVLRERYEDIPYPWLWSLFVAFIIACGLTHSVHVLSAFMGVEYLALQTVVEIVTAFASVGTAIAFALVLPQIKMLPSPRQQRDELQRVVAERSKEKDRLIREINHRIGNQIQVLKSMASIEARKAREQESIDILTRFQAQLDAMAAQHVARSQKDYLEFGVAEADGTIRPAQSPAA
jgi:hypothetical protein